MSKIQTWKIILLCIAAPIIFVFLLCFILPAIIIFLLICALFAPHRIKSTYQHIRSRKKSQKESDSDDIDVECTVLDSKEIDSDS